MPRSRTGWGRHAATVADPALTPPPGPLVEQGVNGAIQAYAPVAMKATRLHLARRARCKPRAKVLRYGARRPAPGVTEYLVTEHEAARDAVGPSKVQVRRASPT